MVAYKIAVFHFDLTATISGQATVRFSECGRRSKISTPTVLNGKGIEISILDLPRIVVPPETTLGTLTVHLALRERLTKDVSNLEFSAG